jgi:pantoate--beta-alanine ligase
MALAAGAPVSQVETEAKAYLTRAGFDSVDYFEVRGPDDLGRLGPGPIACAARILAAAVLGKTRLIDNVAV